MRIKPVLPVGLPISLLIGLLGLAWSWPMSVLAETRHAELKNCELSAAGGRVTASARCGRLEVPENPDDPEGRQIELAFAVVPARGRRTDDAVAFLAGGPGQSARDTLPYMSPALRQINRTRDLIFLDQRGTGGSNPLDCDFSGLDVWLTPDRALMNQAMRDCAAQWDADVRYYTTAHAASDLEALRGHLGIERLNLIGGSYGTRVAQVYLRLYPDRVRSVIIDGVVPTRLRLGSEHGFKLDQSLDRLFAACDGDPECRQRFPELPAALASLIERFSDQSVELMVTHPRSGRAEPVLFNRDVLAGALRILAYSPQTQMMIPYLVHEAAATGEPGRLASQALMLTEQLQDTIAIGLNFAVVCSEDWPVWPGNMDQSQTLLGNSMEDFLADTCQWWPVEPVDSSFHEPFDSDVPVLILSGEFDPVTPPEYGDEAAAQFSNSVHLVGRGRGHIVLTNHCINQIATSFVERASVDDLDISCLDKLGPEPFFTDLLGPMP